MKLILKLVMASLTILSALSPASGSVVINEVELNPPDDGVEWVELYNTGDDSVDIGLWTVSIVEILPTSGRWTGAKKIPKGVVLQAEGYYVWEGDPRWVHGNNGTVYLTTDKGLEVDKTPLLSDEEGKDFTWSRCPNGWDTGQRSDWAFVKSTRGGENIFCIGTRP
ncbi:MAG: lamin tail domain-containing protein [Methanothrix sp.]